MEQQTIIKYSSYTPSQKKATQKYRENNKDKVNEQRKKYYQQRKDKDPNFLEYKRLKAKEYYEKKKAKKINRLSPIIEEEIIPEPILEPVIEEIIPEPTISIQEIYEPFVGSVKEHVVKLERKKRVVKKQ